MFKLIVFLYPTFHLIILLCLLELQGCTLECVEELLVRFTDGSLLLLPHLSALKDSVQVHVLNIYSLKGLSEIYNLKRLLEIYSLKVLSEKNFSCPAFKECNKNDIYPSMN